MQMALSMVDHQLTIKVITHHTDKEVLRFRLAELRCRGTASVEQSSGCSTETGNDTAHFQVTTQGRPVPHLMCQRTERTSTTALHLCGIFCDSGARYETADLLIYFWSDLVQLTAADCMSHH